MDLLDHLISSVSAHENSLENLSQLMKRFFDLSKHDLSNQLVPAVGQNQKHYDHGRGIHQLNPIDHEILGKLVEILWLRVEEAQHQCGEGNS